MSDCQQPAGRRLEGAGGLPRYHTSLLGMDPEFCETVFSGVLCRHNVEEGGLIHIYSSRVLWESIVDVCSGFSAFCAFDFFAHFDVDAYISVSILHFFEFFG